MSATDTKPTKITLDATIRRGFGRDGQYTATLLGLVNATAPTMAEAKAKLSSNVWDYVSSASMSPTFATDDDGSIIVAIPQGGGTAVYRGGAHGFTLCSFAEGSPDDVIDRCHHYTRIGS